CMVWGQPGRFTHGSAWARRVTRNAAVLFGKSGAATAKLIRRIGEWPDTRGPLSSSLFCEGPLVGALANFRRLERISTPTPIPVRGRRDPQIGRNRISRRRTAH